MAEQERSVLQERLSNTQHELAEANVEYERLKREAQAHQEQDKANINNLRSEIENFRVHFDNTT